MACTPHWRLPRRSTESPCSPHLLTRRRLLRQGAIAAGAFGAARLAAAGAHQGVFMPGRIEIPAIEVVAEIEQIHIVNGVMGSPQNPWNVGWYSQLAFPGRNQNVVMAGHKDYWNVGPVVFWELGSLRSGDRIALDDRTGGQLVYEVDTVDQLSASTPPLEYTRGDDGEALTLITCSGDFDGETYDARLIVRARLSA